MTLIITKVMKWSFYSLCLISINSLIVIWDLYLRSEPEISPDILEEELLYSECSSRL